MRVLILGAGPAGVTTAEALRAHDPDVDVTVISAEPHPPYAPPAMADHFLTGSKAHLWRGMDWPERMDVDYRSGVAARRIDPDSHSVSFSDGTALSYDRLVIATGSRLYAPLEGAGLPGVSNFKSLTEAEALMERVHSGEASRALIVGAGFIGVEIAILLRELGLSVTLIEMLDQVMPRMLDSHTAAFALGVLEDRGIDVRLNTRATAFLSEDGARATRLESGDVLEADILVAATGVKPNLDCLAGSGITSDWGIYVDNHLRTSQPDIYAAGDVAETRDLLTGEPYVHAIFPNATSQGRVVGLNLAGYDVEFEGSERMNSLKHLGFPILAVGLKEGDEVMQARMNGGMRTLYLKENRLVGYQLVGDFRPAGALRTLLTRAEDVRPLKDRLLDPHFGQGMLAWKAISSLA
jgi:NADPH-dependent 2,4-dienoyl-CoA reductase/sulfur reductase-like enzyme